MQRDPFTNQELMLAVGDGHTLYVQDWGNPEAATPIFYLHGGPGGRVKDNNKSTFDPTKNRVIFFDQRGCGQSTPLGSLKHNTTDDLVADITKIADELGITKFVLLGNSWGSTLALVYALANPEPVSALVVAGVFTASKAESKWLDGGDFKLFYPDVWQSYLAKTPQEHHDNPTSYHFEKMQNGTPDEKKASSYAYECIEGALVSLDDRFTPSDFAAYDPSGTELEVHYLANGCFLPSDRYILDNAHKLTMSIHIVQSRYDMVCPPAAAYELHQATQDSKLYWTLGGHRIEHEADNVLRAIVAQL